MSKQMGEHVQHRAAGHDSNKRERTVPPRPVIAPDRRLELAREWLQFLDCDADDEFVHQLAQTVMNFHPLSPMGQVANRLVIAGVLPQLGRVLAQYRRETTEGVRLTPAQLRRGRDLAADPRLVGSITTFIRATREQAGAGPTWREVAQHTGLSFTAVRILLRVLRMQDAVTTTRRARSLDVPGQAGPTRNDRPR